MSDRKRITLPGHDPGSGGVPIALRFVGSAKEVPLPPDVQAFGIGGDRVNYLVLQDDFVSGLHCTLERSTATRLVVRDRKSRNGTIVNGARIRECEVGVGARITIGETTMVVIGSRPAEPRSAIEELVGEDPAFRDALRLAVRTAASPVTQAAILVRGESGTGKELVARLIHESSPRASGPFVAINCGAISGSLIESELFGHERGAFTGAVERRRGVFELAHGGTLFLDEIGELPLEQQPRLLRVLETRRLRRVGGQEELAVDVRVVAATHRDLQTAAERKEFRLDLYHRLASIEIRLPPLRERPDDLALLARRFVADLAAELGPRTIGPQALAALATHSWPGNARELRNAIYRAALTSGTELRADAILAHVTKTNAPPSRTERLREPEAPYATVDDVLRDLIARALTKHGSMRKAAGAVGMPKSTFHDLARRLGLERRASDDGA